MKFIIKLLKGWIYLGDLKEAWEDTEMYFDKNK